MFVLFARTTCTFQQTPPFDMLQDKSSTLLMVAVGYATAVRARGARFKNIINLALSLLLRSCKRNEVSHVVDW